MSTWKITRGTGAERTDLRIRLALRCASGRHSGDFRQPVKVPVERMHLAQPFSFHEDHGERIGGPQGELRTERQSLQKVSSGGSQDAHRIKSAETLLDGHGLPEAHPVFEDVGNLRYLDGRRYDVFTLIDSRDDRAGVRLDSPLMSFQLSAGSDISMDEDTGVHVPRPHPIASGVFSERRASPPGRILHLLPPRRNSQFGRTFRGGKL